MATVRGAVGRPLGWVREGTRVFACGLWGTALPSALAVVLSAIVGGCTPEPPVTCESIVARFKTTWPSIYQAAGAPTISCFDRGPEAGAGGYAHGPNQIDVNTRPSKLAREHGVEAKDLPEFWMTAISHETGHAYAHSSGFDDRWPEWAKLRGIPDEMGKNGPQEDYAETFSLWLGWHGPPKHYTRHHPGGYFDFQHPGGKPTAEQLRHLHQLGWLPDK